LVVAGLESFSNAETGGGRSLESIHDSVNASFTLVLPKLITRASFRFSKRGDAEEDKI
jgi:hypothetical protein